MKYDDLLPGVYEAQLTDWGMEMVEKVGSPKIVLKFEFDHEGKNYVMKFESFLFKKDKDVSKKTLDTLMTVGFNSKNVWDINEDFCQLDTSKKYSIDCVKDEKGFFKIEWVNSSSGLKIDKIKAKKTLAGYDLSRFNGALMAQGSTQPKRVIKNYAPGASSPSTVDDNSEIPF